MCSESFDRTKYFYSVRYVKDGYTKRKPLRVLLFNVLGFDQTEVRNLGGYLTRVVVGVIGVCVFLGDGWEQKDASLVLGRSLSVSEWNIRVVVGPVGGSRDRLFVTKLECLDAADDLVSVAAHTGRVVEGEHKLVLGVHNEDGTDRQWEVLIVAGSGIDHSVGRADGSIGIPDDGELYLDVVLAVGNNVAQPFLVGLDGVDREGGDKAFHFSELVVLESQSADLGGADGCSG